MVNVFSHTSGAWARGFVYESRAQCCLLVVCLLSAIADVYFRAPVPTQLFV